MSLHRRAARRDENEGDIVDALRGVGATVWQVSGTGLPDLTVGWKGCTYLLEVKMPGKALTQAQRDVHADWRGSTIHVVTSPEEALAVLGFLPAAERLRMDPDAVPPPRKRGA